MILKEVVKNKIIGGIKELGYLFLFLKDKIVNGIENILEALDDLSDGVKPESSATTLFIVFGTIIFISGIIIGIKGLIDLKNKYNTENYLTEKSIQYKKEHLSNK